MNDEIKVKCPCGGYEDACDVEMQEKQEEAPRK